MLYSLAGGALINHPAGHPGMFQHTRPRINIIKLTGLRLLIQEVASRGGLRQLMESRLARQLGQWLALVK